MNISINQNADREGRHFCLFYGNGLNLTQAAFGDVLHSHAASGGLGDEVLSVNGVERGKVCHIRQEAGGLDHFAHIGAGSFYDGPNILAALVGLGGDALGHLAGGRVNGNLSGGDDQVTEFVALGVGADGARGVGGSNGFHGDSPFRLI